MSQFLISSLGLLGALVAATVDGRRAVVLAAAAVGLGLTPAALAVGGAPEAAVPLVAAAMALLAGPLSRRLAERLPGVPGLNPAVPVVSPRAGLFGPRSIRVAATALAMPAASWVSLNVEVGGVATAKGVVFAAAFTWLVGAARLLVGRTVEDLAVGAAVVGMAGGVSWTVQVGPSALAAAVLLAALAPMAAATSGWLSGRHRRGVQAARGDSAGAQA